jgi:hypothetical protein
MAASADMLLLYDAGQGGTGLNTDYFTTTPTQVVEHLTGTDLTVSPAQGSVNLPQALAGSGSPPDTDNYFNEDDWAVTDNSRYYQVGFTVEDGYVARLTGMTFWERAFGSSPTNYFVRSSLDGFTSNLGAGATDSGWDEVQLSFTRGVVGTVNFRIYAQNASDPTAIWRVDHILLDGTVELIPEPSSVALIGLAGLALFASRLRR